MENDILLKKLKKRPSYPFETIAVALAFSPRLEAILCEAARLASRLSSKLVLIHVGEKNREKEEHLDKLIAKTNINSEDARIIWTEGEPVDTILKLCKLNIVDLLILGALEKESLFRFYVGSVARKISRKAKCSVLLITQPSVESTKPRKIVVSGVENAKTIHSLNTALYVARNYGIKEITVVKEVSSIPAAMKEDNSAPEISMLKKKIMEEESDHLHALIEKSDKGEIEVNEKTVQGKVGYAIANYTRSKKADLLVINSPDVQLNLLDRIFTHDIEYILADLPSNLLIVHSRV